MASSDTQPNILFIITDHHAYFGHYLQDRFTYEWPQFESFIRDGIFFRRAYSVCPICTPARASMMTGVYPNEHGLVRNTDGGNPLSDFVQGQLLYSHYLSQAGYRNAYIGKWHCGGERLPIDYGMEGWSLPHYGNIYNCAAYNDYCKKNGYGKPRATIEHCVNRPDWEGKNFIIQDEKHGTYMSASGMFTGHPEAHEISFVTNLAMNKLTELSKARQPFSLVASYWSPHDPYYPTEEYASAVPPEDIPEYPSFRDDLQGRPLRYFLHRNLHHNVQQWRDWSLWQEILGRCYGQCIQLDAAIGKLLTTLQELGLKDNTIVIWCADHGDCVACHGGLWEKDATFNEEMARVPMAIRWPEKVTGGSVCDKLVSNLDVTATILDAAGVSVPDSMQSRSMLPLCYDPESEQWPEHIISQHFGHGQLLCQRIIVSGKYKYAAALYDMDELYDLERDPYEMDNLIDSPKHKDVKDELRSAIIRHLEQKERNHDPQSIKLLESLRLGF